MNIEELKSYIKSQHDKAYNTFLRETSGWCMEARLRHDSSARGVVDFAGKLLNLINYGYEEAPKAVVEEAFKKRCDAMSKGFGTFQEAQTFYEEKDFIL
jgi:hypothetical protein